MNRSRRQFSGGIIAGVGLGLAIAYWLRARFGVSIGIQLFFISLILMTIGGVVARKARPNRLAEEGSSAGRTAAQKP